MRLIEILKAVRAERQLSQDDIAERTGMARTYISRVENAKMDPRLSTLEKIASKGLGASLDEVIHLYWLQHDGETPAQIMAASQPMKRRRASAKTLAQIKRLFTRLEKEATP